MDEPNFKVYTDIDTPSGDASLLQINQLNEQRNDIMSSTALSSVDSTERPDSNLSTISPTIQVSHAQITPSIAPVELPGTPVSSIACDLCGQIVKGRAYLTQHRNKKKCLEKQRIRRETEQTMSQHSVRMSELSVDNSTGQSSQVRISEVINPT